MTSAGQDCVTGAKRSCPPLDAPGGHSNDTGHLYYPPSILVPALEATMPGPSEMEPPTRDHGVQASRCLWKEDRGVSCLGPSDFFPDLQPEGQLWGVGVLRRA